MVSGTTKHYPVLLSELISIITPQHGGTFIDCTFGQGGYSNKILSYKDTKVIALDRDIESQKKAQEILKSFQNRFKFKNKKFSRLGDLKLKEENIKAVIFDMDGVLIDAKDWHYDALNKALEIFGARIELTEHLSTFDGLPTCLLYTSPSPRDTG